MNPVTMYSKETCPYCVHAEQLLHRKGVANLVKIRIDENPGELKNMIERTGRRTVPQIYVGDTHVGGFDDLAALDREGKLDILLSQ
ncbi:MAG: glutaredoxin 3 [Gallionella sp.]|nr:glutaredoxin 3 [Gallionella sp.]MDD4946868.1 glutaredoxin 3 [Gallionella sp.]